MSRVQKTVSPVDGRVYVERTLPRDEEVLDAVEKARVAQLEWKLVSLEERADLLTAMVEAVIKKSGIISEELSWQMGRPIRHSPLELRGFEERSRYMIEAAHQALARIVPGEKAGFHRSITREPLGVVFVIAPWNYPWLTSVNAVVPALMAGNTVLLKHSTQTPLVAERYSEAAREAGLPQGVLSHLHLSHDQTSRVIRNDAVEYVSFTGSVEGGREVHEAGASRFINMGLELGGKDSAYVRADADLAASIETLVDGACFNAGQSCCGIKRIYVDRSIYKPFLDGFVDLVHTYKLGDPLDPETTMGPLAKAAAADALRSRIGRAVSLGARKMIDEKRFPMARPESPYFAPQVLVNVDHSMEIMKEESFGPVVGMMPTDSDGQAIQLMNDSPFGLTGSVFTKDSTVAREIGRQVDVGTWFMNRCDYLDPALAWVGVKSSGRGCSLSLLGYESLTRPKSFHLKLAT